MTETECWVSQTCERIVASGHVRLYRDLYRDLRQKLSCTAACRLIASGLHATRFLWRPMGTYPSSMTRARRARAIAALKRLERYAVAKAQDTWLTPGGACAWEV